MYRCICHLIEFIYIFFCDEFRSLRAVIYENRISNAFRRHIFECKNTKAVQMWPINRTLFMWTGKRHLKINTIFYYYLIAIGVCCFECLLKCSARARTKCRQPPKWTAFSHTQWTLIFCPWISWHASLPQTPRQLSNQQINNNATSHREMGFSLRSKWFDVIMPGTQTTISTMYLTIGSR